MPAQKNNKHYDTNKKKEALRVYIYINIYIHIIRPNQRSDAKPFARKGFPDLMKLIEHLNILVWSCADMIYAYIIYKCIHLYNRYEDRWRALIFKALIWHNMTIQISWSPHIKYHLLWRRARWFYLYFAQLDRPHLSLSSQGNFHQFSLVATASLN